ncbi:MAG: hypothetical protein KC912_21305 [Proteobacteria bacterium]|nr:hypothetical protein [Pseudomonadota bacterium]
MRNLPLVLMLAACQPWNLHPRGDSFIDAPLWDPMGAAATADGLYIPLPHTQGLVRITAAGDSDLVDLGGAALAGIEVTPDQQALVAFLSRVECPEDEDGERPSECDRPKVTQELSLISNGAVTSAVEVDPHFNAVEFSASGNQAVAYLDVERELRLEGVINLTEVAVLDLQTDEVESVQVGFAAERILFTEDDSRAVVLSRSEVAVLDLTTSPPTTDVVFPLTLDPDSTVTPVGVTLTPDGRYAMISVQGSADLYVLDLELHSVNIVSLSANPSDMVVDPGTDRTVLTYGGRARVDVLEHEFFEVDSFTLDEPMNQIAQGEGLAVLYSTNSSYKDVYRLDLATQELVEYRLENPAIELVMAPTEEYAIALTRAEGGVGTGVSGLYDGAPGMEIVDLRPGSNDTYPYLLEAAGLGLSFSATETALHALVLQQGIDYVYQLDLYTGDDQEIALSVPPLAIGSMPDGSFFITQDSAFGRVSFLDPGTGEIQEVEGFALNNLLDPTAPVEVN